jgi:PAS domain S-box-containing protein
METTKKIFRGVMFSGQIKLVMSGMVRTLPLFLLIWALSLSQALAQTQPQIGPLIGQKNILVLHTFQSNLPGNIKTDQGITSSLLSGGVDVKNQFFEYLDLPRNPSPEHRKVLTELMRSRYSQGRIDMIITQYPEALQFLLNEGRTVFPEVPILALHMFPHVELPKTGRLIIQHSNTIDMIGTLESALKLVPGAKRVYVVGGVSSVDRTFENQARQDFKKWEGQPDFRYLSNMSFEDMLSEVSSAPPGTIVLFTALTADITGETYIPRDVVQRLSQVSKAPIFGLYDTLLGYGIAGGYLISFEHIGTRAGRLVLDILGGTQTPENTSAVMDVPPLPMFDWRHLKHWNLSVDALPKGSIVVNKELTVWDLRYYAIGVLAFCLAETALVIVLIIQRRRKKVAEEGLRQRTEELDQFFNVNMDLFCIANTSGYFSHLNPIWEKVFGYTRDEMMAKRFLEFIHPDDVEHTEKALSVLGTQEHLPIFVNRYRCRDGTYRWLEWNSAPVGNLIYAAARDVTERKQAEEALRESEARLSLAADSAGAILWSMEIPTSRIWTTEKVEESLGLAGSEGLNFETFLNRVHSEDRERVRRAVLQAVRTRQEYRAEYRIVRPDGGLRWTTSRGRVSFDASGQPDRLMGVSIDITERKRGEEAVRTSEEKFRQFFSFVPDYCYIVSPDGTILDVNNCALSALGYERRELVGKPLATIYAPESLAKMKELFATWKKEGEIKNEEMVIRCKDGEKRVVLLNVGAVRGEDGTILYSASVQTDITERKRVEVEAFRVRRELLQLERLSRMGELSASLAHELNQPLTSILSNARAALRFIESDRLDIGELKEILQDIANDDKRAGDIIRSLRSMVRPEEGERERILINDVLQDVISLFHSEAIIRNINVENDFADPLPPVNANKVQIQQVVINLMMNAADSMLDVSKNRRIVIQTQTADDGGALVAVRDFGLGIEAAELDKIFEPFFTTKRSGLGMGLSLSRSIIEAHGGHIWVENNLDKGATFYFDLPAASGK